ncbi:Fic family protein [Pseudactinotalea suaedae]|uniref:Fic family protein n=1 Tax=Pseudactinotalea suaedae TaxID=1524924 RepID=UPI0012E2CABE|nr:Fic family protein [Pseudactinotalea suaedae]
MSDAIRGAGSTWPAVQPVAQIWHPTATLGRDAGKPYEASLSARIAALTPRLAPETAALARDATAELTRFDAELGHRVETFAPLLLRSEASSSSQIEDLTASARSILTAEAGGKGSRNAAEIVANTRALTAAIDLAGPIATEHMLRMHAVLMHDQPQHTPGEWRAEPVWIGTRSDSPIGAEYVAAPAEAIPDLIDDLVAFTARSDLDPFVQVAIAHAQFETIHPFPDGNGRVGRALAQSMLRHAGITRSVAVPVSAGLLADLDGYHGGLTAYRSGDIEPIVSSFAHAASRAVANSRQLVTELDDIHRDWSARLTARRSSNAWRLLDLLISRPVVTAATAAEELGVSRPNIYPSLRQLEEAGIVQSRREHGLGDFLWRADDVLEALDRFAARAGRRARG